MRRITFERVRERVTYSHSIKPNGNTVALTPISQLVEGRVGVVFCIEHGNEYPSDEQRQAISYLASLATGYDLTVEVVFGEGTSPFPAIVPSNHPLASMFAI